MGYTIYWEPNEDMKKLHENEKRIITGITKLIFHRELKELGLLDKWFDYLKDYKNDTEDNFHEVFLDEGFLDESFQGLFDRIGSCKTHFRKYDPAVKWALIALQKMTDNGFHVSCDESCVYDKDTQTLF